MIKIASCHPFDRSCHAGQTSPYHVFRCVRCGTRDHPRRRATRKSRRGRSSPHASTADARSGTLTPTLTTSPEAIPVSATLEVIDPDRDSIAPAPTANDLAQAPAEPYGEITVPITQTALQTLAAEPPRASFDDCDQFPGDRTPVGRFSECNDTAVEITLYGRVPPNPQPVPIGIMVAEVANLADGFNGDNQVIRTVRVQNMSSTGTSYPYTLGVQFMARPAFGGLPGQCGDSSSVIRRTRDEWIVNPLQSYSFEPGLIGAHGTDLIQHCQYNLRITATVYPPGQPPITPLGIDILPGLAICDQASYIYEGTLPLPTGCRLDIRPTFEVSLSNPLVDESAQHIQDALNDPSKDVPHVLTRLFHDTARRELNRAISRQYCVDNEGPTPPNMDCDEFPFASTYQGAAQGNGNFSARYIDYQDNRRVGAILNAFMNAYRVIDSEGLDRHQYEIRVVD